jgi:hypothetical protein
MENASVAGTVAVVGLGTTLFTSFMPDMSDLRVSNIDSTNSVQVRHAQIVGAITTIAFAAIISYWSHSPIPLGAGVLTVLTLSGAYEISLHLESGSL